jgi:hypothetical protein
VEVEKAGRAGEKVSGWEEKRSAKLKEVRTER